MRDSDRLTFVSNLDHLLDDHMPSLTDEDEQAITDEMYKQLGTGFDPTTSYDVVDLARRTCKCGKRIVGFEEYAAHLLEVAGE